MRLNIKIQNLFLEFICLLYILLFVYAAVSKLIDFDNFQAQLGQSPLLSAYTGFVSYTVILIEIIIAVLLSIPRFRLIGLFTSFCLMVMFTAYIIIITNYSSYVPCSCGGILENMDWNEHLIFNICFVVLAVIAILSIINISNENESSGNKIKSKYSLDNKSATILLGVLTFICFTFIVGLYISSDDLMHNENPFIRRFIQGASIKMEEKDVKSTSLYFAGSENGKIFIGDNLAPLHILEYDSLLHQTEHYKIKLERENFPFRSVQVRIAPPYFYVTDGTVPVIFKGNISDWKASIIMDNNSFYFSKAVIIDSSTIAFRARQQITLDNILGTFNFKDGLTVIPTTSLLEKQIDGFFDTDGTMHYDKESKKFVYTYFYRNQFIVADNTLKLLYRGKTIDTTAHANIKIAFIKSTGERKFASTPKVVNNLSAISGNLLFINSKLIGRYESRAMWKKATVVDIYDVNKGIYLSSIYLYNVEKLRANDFTIIGSNLYVLVGNYLHHYILNRNLINGNKITGR
ncbi:MAG TPA: MauE/DoxX family redox-associated membrane protein [Flavobacterium sp.]|uniref:DoxX family protein n=1 Tax=Flavobacterium sp. TaxID=239 RepID=UPI002DBF3B28|nr:MauE/DoxX family redox-associated membrane protein [Flavobacterium sp.]HEU4791811.1 MauE/DoxX family redox-associated membrane protein [Flavobacterium sp.]